MEVAWFECEWRVRHEMELTSLSVLQQGGEGQTGHAYSNVSAMCLDAGEPMD